MSNVPQFRRATILSACDLIAEHHAMYTHAAFDGFVLEIGAESAVPTGTNQGTIAEKANTLKKHLIANPSARTPDGEFMSDAVVHKAASLPFSYQESKFVRALAADSFTVTEGGMIRRMLPNVADLPSADDEVHALLGNSDLLWPRDILTMPSSSTARGSGNPRTASCARFLKTSSMKPLLCSIPVMPRRPPREIHAANCSQA